MATFLIKLQCREGGMCTCGHVRVLRAYKPGQTSLSSLFHYMNQKYISVGLHKRRESTLYCRFALDDVYGA